MNRSLLQGGFSWHVARIGGVLRSLLLTLCGIVALGGAALILEPTALVAVTHPPVPVDDAQRARDEFTNTLAQLISDSREVLAVHHHSATSPASIVLWMDDPQNAGEIDPAEVVVVSHSQLLRTITIYSFAPSSDRPLPGSSGSNAPRGLKLSGPLDRIALGAEAFPERWRATPLVQPHTIATGISDMRIERLNGGASGDESATVMRLWLRWSADSADGAGEASAMAFAHAGP